MLEKDPKDYADILAVTEQKKGDALTMKDLEEAMNTQFRIRYGDTEKDDEGESELALSAFSGTCYKCNKKGHKANNCLEKKQSGQSGGKFKGKCNGCGKTGHRYADCWENPKNADKRPQWLKDKTNNNEQAAVAADSSGGSGYNGGAEFLLMGMNEMEFNNSRSILEDPNVFIGDTGATSDSMFSKLGLKNVRKATEEDTIVDASKNKITGSVVGDMPSIICNKHGQELRGVNIQDVVYSPKNGFNLFSITKRLKIGWTLGGNADSLWITKGEKKVVFDIKIETPKGIVFAIYFKRSGIPEGEVAAVTHDKEIAITAATAHGLTGHIHEAQSRKIVTHLGYTLKREKMMPCAPCALTKAKQKSLPPSEQII